MKGVKSRKAQRDLLIRTEDLGRVYRVGTRQVRPLQGVELDALDRHANAQHGREATFTDDDQGLAPIGDAFLAGDHSSLTTCISYSQKNRFTLGTLIAGRTMLST